MSVILPVDRPGAHPIVVVISSGNDAQSAVFRSQPGMGNNGKLSPEIDTGGERRLNPRGGLTWGFDIPGWE